MKKVLKIISIIFGAVIILRLFWFTAIIYLFTEVHPYEIDPVPSPNGSRVAIPSVSYDKNSYDTYLLVHIEVQDTESGETLFKVLTGASDRMRWSVDWIDNNTVRLDSSDIGFYCWTDAEDTWDKVDCPEE